MFQSQFWHNIMNQSYVSISRSATSWANRIDIQFLHHIMSQLGIHVKTQCIITVWAEKVTHKQIQPLVWASLGHYHFPIKMLPKTANRKTLQCIACNTCFLSKVTSNSSREYRIQSLEQCDVGMTCTTALPPWMRGQDSGKGFGHTSLLCQDH